MDQQRSSPLKTSKNDLYNVSASGRRSHEWNREKQAIGLARKVDDLQMYRS